MTYSKLNAWGRRKILATVSACKTRIPAAAHVRKWNAYFTCAPVKTISPPVHQSMGRQIVAERAFTFFPQQVWMRARFTCFMQHTVKPYTQTSMRHYTPVIIRKGERGNEIGARSIVSIHTVSPRSWLVALRLPPVLTSYLPCGLILSLTIPKLHLPRLAHYPY